VLSASTRPEEVRVSDDFRKLIEEIEVEAKAEGLRHPSFTGLS
jgi:hypothetical protein